MARWRKVGGGGSRGESEAGPRFEISLARRCMRLRERCHVTRLAPGRRTLKVAEARLRPAKLPPNDHDSPALYVPESNEYYHDLLHDEFAAEFLGTRGMALKGTVMEDRIAEWDWRIRVSAQNAVL